MESRIVKVVKKYPLASIFISFVTLSFLIIITPFWTQYGTQYDKLLSPDDIEKVTSLKGVKQIILLSTDKIKLYEFDFPEEGRILFLNISSTDNNIDLHNRLDNHGFTSFYRAGIGDKSYIVPGHSLVFKKGKYTISLSHYSKNNHFPNIFFRDGIIEETLYDEDDKILSDSHLKTIARIIESRLSI